MRQGVLISACEMTARGGRARARVCAGLCTCVCTCVCERCMQHKNVQTSTLLCCMCAEGHERAPCAPPVMPAAPCSCLNPATPPHQARSCSPAPEAHACGPHDQVGLNHPSRALACCTPLERGVAACGAHGPAPAAAFQQTPQPRRSKHPDHNPGQRRHLERGVAACVAA